MKKIVQYNYFWSADQFWQNAVYTREPLFDFWWRTLPNFLYYIHNYFNFLRFFCFIILKSYCTYLILQPLTKFVYVYIFSAFIISQNIEIADFDWVMTAPLKANLPLFVNHWRVNTYFSLPLRIWPVRAIADIKWARV